jgi:hypothetical protein
MTQTFFAECYWPGVDQARLEAAVERLGPAQQPNVGVRWVDATLIPADEIVLCVFEAPSAGAVRATTDRAGMPSERILECIRLSTAGSSDPKE